MKNVKFVLAALVSAFFVVSSVVASGTNTDASELKSSENTLRQQIVKVVSNIPYEGTAVVFVKFSVDAQNGFSINEVVSTDNALASTVKRVLAKTSLFVPTALDGSYMLKIKFVADESFVVVDAPSKTSVLREAISQNLANVYALEGTSVDVTFAVKDNSIVVKKVDSYNESLAKSVSLALANAKIDESAKYDGYYQVTVKF